MLFALLGYTFLILLTASGLIFVADHVLPAWDALVRRWREWKRHGLPLVRRDDLHDVFAREDALAALARLTRPPRAEAYDGVHFCRMCNGRILVENSYQGICDDCWNRPMPIEVTREADLTSLDVEWADLMRAIDDEHYEQEDHR